MRIPNTTLGKYQKSYNKTKKIIRTISRQKLYIQKQQKQQAEMEQEIQAYLVKQKELERETQEKLNNAMIDLQAQDISYKLLLYYGIKKIGKEKIIEKLKARKAN